MEKSCGIIPLKVHNNTFLYLLIQHHAGHWGFPKGHVEPGESMVETAMRELEEETGLTLKKIFLKQAFEEKYTYHRDGKKRSKLVVYYLGLVEGGKVKIQAKEIQDYAWVTLAEAIERLAHTEIKKILLRSQQYLGK